MKPLVIMVAGPYSAPTPEGRAANLRRMNEAAAALARRGHVPVIGVNAALPVLEAAGLPHTDALMMTISLAGLALRCLSADRPLARRRPRGRRDQGHGPAGL